MLKKNMDIDNSIEILEEDCKNIIKRLKNNIAGINMGSADTQLLNGISIKTSYGSSNIMHISKVSVQDNKTITIKPYMPEDGKSIISELEKKSLGVISKQQGVIYLTLPPLTMDTINVEKKKLQTYGQDFKDQLKYLRQSWRKKYTSQKEAVGKDHFSQLEKQVDKVIKKYQEEVENSIKDKKNKIDKFFSIK